MLLNNQRIAEKNNQEGNLKISGDKWKYKHNDPKSVRHSSNSSKRDLQLYKPTSGNKKNPK